MNFARGGRVVQWCWVNFQCWDVLLIWIIVGQGPIVLAVGAGGGSLDIFSLIFHFSFLSPSLWETVRYRLKYCLKGPLSPNQPTNQHEFWVNCAPPPTHTHTPDTLISSNIWMDYMNFALKSFSFQDFSSCTCLLSYSLV